MVAVERQGDALPVALVALHHALAQAAPRRLAGRQRAELQQLAAREVARHREAAGLQQPEPRLLAAMQVADIELGRRARLAALGRRVEVERREVAPPVAGERGARRRLGGLERRRRPFLEALLEQRQVEQPFARIVDDHEVEQAMLAEPAAQRALDREAQLQAQRGEAIGRRRPLRLGCRERGARRLEREARQVARRRRQQAGAEQPVLLHRGEKRQLAPAQQMVHEGRDEHGLAAAAQPGDREPQRAVEREVGEVLEALLELGGRRQAREVAQAAPGHPGGHQKPTLPARIARQTSRPASRLLRKRLRQERGSSMSSVRICQAKCAPAASSSR